MFWQLQLDGPVGMDVQNNYQLVGGWALPLLKNMSQWEGWHPIYEVENKSHVPVTTNQSIMGLWSSLFSNKSYMLDMRNRETERFEGYVSVQRGCEE